MYVSCVRDVFELTSLPLFIFVRWCQALLWYVDLHSSSFGRVHFSSDDLNKEKKNIQWCSVSVTLWRKHRERQSRWLISNRERERGWCVCVFWGFPTCCISVPCWNHISMVMSRVSLTLAVTYILSLQTTTENTESGGLSVCQLTQSQRINSKTKANSSISAINMISSRRINCHLLKCLFTHREDRLTNMTFSPCIKLFAYN